MNLTNVVYVVLLSNLLLVNCSNMVDFSFSIINKNLNSPVESLNTETSSSLLTTSLLNNKISTNVHRNATRLSIIPLIAVVSYQDNNLEFSKVKSEYVDWLLSGGNQVVFISPWMSVSEVDSVLNNSHGVLIPGYNHRNNKVDENGANEKTIKKVLDSSIKINKNGVHFPVLAIAQASLVVQSEFAKSYNILKTFEGVEGVMNKVEVVGDPKKIRAIKMFSKRQFGSFVNHTSTAHCVNYAVDPSFYYKTPNIANKNLIENLKLTGVSYDKNGKKYVSMFEGVTIPIFGFIFNPQMVPWTRDKKKSWLDYSADTIEISQKFLNYFTLIARLSNVKINDENLIQRIKSMRDLGSNDGYYKIKNERNSAPLKSDSMKKIKQNKSRDRYEKILTVNSDSLEEAWGNPFESQESSYRNYNNNSNRILLLRQTFKGPFNK